MSKTFKYPFIPVSYASMPVKSLINPAQKLIKKVESLPPDVQEKELRELDDLQLIGLLEHVETLDKSIRSSLSSELFEDVKLAGTLKKLGTDVQVFEYPNTEFVMYFPPLVGCSYRTGEYGISRRAEYELAAWFREHDIPKYGKDSPIVFSYRRFIMDGDKGVCDNDNMEMRRITNSVVGAMYGSDKATILSFMYSTFVSDFRGVELAVFKRNKQYKLDRKLAKNKPLIHPKKG